MSSNLTGLWIGQYRYPDGSLHPVSLTQLKPVSFTADIFDQGGAFWGEITEDDGPPSQIRGTREGSSITFSKRYANTGGGRFLDRIIYEGRLNKDSTRLDGIWVIVHPSARPGEFFMMREKPMAHDDETEREAEAV